MKMNKIILLCVLSLLVLSGCKRPFNSSEEPSNSLISSSESSLSSNTTSNSTVSEESSEGSSAPQSSEESSDIPPSSHSEPINEDVFIDDIYARNYETPSTSYSIPTVIPSSDPYININDNYAREAFYADNYRPATSYEDAMFRTNHGLISGDISDAPLFNDYPINHLPNRKYRFLHHYRINEGTYEYNVDDSFRSYTINNLEGKTKTIYYGAGYVTLEEVAAYLFAFGEGPANYETGKTSSAMANTIYSWSEYGRVNDAYYSSDVTEYLYEPSLPHTDNGGPIGENMYDYHELDFGYTEVGWGFGILSSKPYNDGDSITRGTVRFVYSAKTKDGLRGAKYIPVEHRHVFLTYNHYNDFIEYLNYEGGWGKPFGWMSAGNDYVAGMRASGYGPGYYDFVDPFPQTTYPIPSVKSLSELKSLLNN